MSNKIIYAGVALAVVVGIMAAGRIYAHRIRFDRLVASSLRSSSSYDQNYINLVKKLEKEISTRAQFGYQGGKDPMTGRVRKVVRLIKPANTAEVKASEPQPDSVRLAAIVTDDKGGNFTAVLMIKERSFSVGRGEVVEGFTVTKIQNNGVSLKKGDRSIFYDTQGGSRPE